MLSTPKARIFSKQSALLRVLTGIVLTVSLIASGQVFAQSADAAAPRVAISTSMGDIVIELNEIRAPQTVKNFLQYVDDGFYSETLFHRVIDGFMIQGGGFSKQYQRKRTRSPISNEAYNGLRNERYSIAMARTTAPHSATSQFFINSADNRNLDHTDTSQRGWGYTVFGKVVEGREVVDAIGQTRTGPGGPFSRDVPVEPVVILSAVRLVEPAPESNAVTDDTSKINASPAMDKPANNAGTVNGIRVNAVVDIPATGKTIKQPAEQN